MRGWRSVLLCMLCLAAPAAVFGHSHLSDDPRVARARALIGAGALEEALGLLRRLPADHPDRTDIRFLAGLAAIRAAERAGDEASRGALLDEAVAALRAILVDDPSLVRVRFELARAFFLKGRDGLARRHFRQVLASRLQPGVAEHVGGYLQVIRARRRWDAWIRLQAAGDTNVAAASDEESVLIAGVPFRMDGSSRARSGIGVAVKVGGEYRHRLGARLQWRLGADATFDLGSGRTFVAARTGPRLLIDAASELSLLGVARQWRGGGPERRETGLRIEAERRLTDRLTVNGHASWSRRRDRKPGGDFDGPMRHAALGAAWLASPTVRVDASAGWLRQRPRAPRWRNRGLQASLGVSVAARRGLTLGASVSWQRTVYEGNWHPLTRTPGEPRKDRLIRLRAAALNRGFTLHGFSPELAVVREVNRSSAQLRSYRRNRLEAQLIQQF